MSTKRRRLLVATAGIAMLTACGGIVSTDGGTTGGGAGGGAGGGGGFGGGYTGNLMACTFGVDAYCCSQPNPPAAWRHEEDPDRVISASQKDQALRDGGASASSVRAYTFPLRP